MDEYFIDLLTAFGIDAANCILQPLGKGHIHDTYLVERISPDAPPLVLQKINTTVFCDPELLMHNMERITAHIAYKHREMGEDPAKKGILLLETDDGKSWIGDDEKGHWRMFWLIQDQLSYDRAPNARLAREGGKSIAEFQAFLQDLDPALIEDTIPGFHDLSMRSKQFAAAMTEGLEERIKKARVEIQKAKNFQKQSMNLYDTSEKLNFPVRLNHNDTKFNNILFSKEGSATCMIDLDTVMKGYSWFDFGDALRTCASSTDEEETNPENIHFQMDIFEAFTEGYLSRAASFLTADEIAYLHLAPAVMTYMQGLRFMTDYLKGDVYYKTSSQEQNLIRARGQFTLMERMHEKEPKMAEIIKSLPAD